MKRTLAAMLSILFLCPVFGREAKAMEDHTEYNEVIAHFYEMMNMELAGIEHMKGTEEYIIQHDKIMDFYSYSFGVDVPETIYDVFTDDEIRRVAEVVEAETCGAPFGAKVNVASVIFNRYQDSTCDFPDELDDIVNQAGQFASGKSNVTDETIHAIEYAYTIGDSTGGALWFNKSGINSWAERNREKLFTDEVGHSFYR